MTGLSLRARLLIGLVALTVVGLAVAAAVTYEEQRAFLLTRVDQQVGDSRIPVSVALELIHPQGATTNSRQPAGGSAPGTFQTSGTYGIALDSSGKVIESRSFTYGETPASPPSLPRPLSISQFSAHDVHLFTVNSQAGSSLTYRAAAFTLKDGGTLVNAVPLHDVDQTLQRLIEVEALVRLSGPSMNGVEARSACAGFSPMRRTSSRTPLVSIRGYAVLFRLGAAREPAEMSSRWAESRPRRRGWAAWSRACCCWLVSRNYRGAAG